MSQTPEEVAALFQSRLGIGKVVPEPNENGGDDEDDEATVAARLTDEERTFRTDKLKEVLATLQNYWAAGDERSFEELAAIAAKIGDGAREPSWRLPIRESGLLDFFLTLLATDHLTFPLKRQTLRVLGNASADNDENRAKVVESGQLKTIITLLQEGPSELIPLLIPVIYNISVDYEPAQLQACEAGLSKILVDIISGPKFSECEPVLNVAIRILELLVGQDPEPKVANIITPAVLLDLVTNPDKYSPDLEEWTAICTVALAYLTYEQFQTNLLTSGKFEVLQQAFYSHVRLETFGADPDVIQQLGQVFNAFVTIFADISALPAFTELYPLADSPPALQTLVSWLDKSNAPNLPTAACLCLGNLARSDESSTALVTKLGVHEKLAKILSNSFPPKPAPADPSSTKKIPVRPPSPQLLHATLSFLKNLSIPASNKPIIGNLLLNPAQDGILPRLWTTTTAQPQVQFAAVSLTRLLLVNCPANIRFVCARLPSSSSSTTNKDEDTKPTTKPTNLQILMDLAAHSDTEPTKIEVARAVASVSKALLHLENRKQDDQQEEPILSSEDWPTGVAGFYTTHAPSMPRTLATLLIQPKFPTVRSEALFALALMSRSSDSAAAKVALQSLESVDACKALSKVILGRDDAVNFDDEIGSSRVTELADDGTERPAEEEEEQQLPDLASLGLNPQGQQQQQPGAKVDTSKMDRENALVLVAEILRRFSGDESSLSSSRKKAFEELLKKGGEVILEERKQ